MALDGAVHLDGQYAIVLPATTITTAVTGVAGTVFKGLSGVRYLVCQCIFTYGSGGTNATMYLQTSFDQGTTWVDIMAFQFTTATATKISAVNTYIAPASQAFAPTDGSLTANTIIQGALGSRIRSKLTTTGTYGGSTTISATVAAMG